VSSQLLDSAWMIALVVVVAVAGVLLVLKHLKRI